MNHLFKTEHLIESGFFDFLRLDVRAAWGKIEKVNEN